MKWYRQLLRNERFYCPCCLEGFSTHKDSLMSKRNGWGVEFYHFCKVKGEKWRLLLPKKKAEEANRFAREGK